MLINRWHVYNKKLSSLSGVCALFFMCSHKLISTLSVSLSAALITHKEMSQWKRSMYTKIRFHFTTINSSKSDDYMRLLLTSLVCAHTHKAMMQDASAPRLFSQLWIEGFYGCAFLSLDDRKFTLCSCTVLYASGIMNLQY